MIRINLLPTRAAGQATSQRKEIALAGGILATTLIAIFAVHSLQFAKLTMVNGNRDRLEKELAQIRKENSDLEKLEQRKKDLEEKIRVVNLLTSPRRRTASVHVLDDLSSSTPEFLWLTEYNENKSATQIRGKAIDNQTIASFANNLTTSSYFRNVEIRETQQEAQTTARGRRNAAREDTATSVMMTKFLIEAKIQYGPSPEAVASQDIKKSSKDKKSEKKRDSQKH